MPARLPHTYCDSGETGCSRQPIAALSGCRHAIVFCVLMWSQIGLSASLLAQASMDGRDARQLVAALEQATVQAIAKAERSVVAISRIRKDRAPVAQLDPLRLGVGFPMLDLPQDPDFVPTFFGSGILISSDGLIVTCAHVLDDPRRNDYYVWLDRRSYPAQVVGKPARVMASDPFGDLAVLQIDATGLVPIEYAKPAEPTKGQFVIALGNPDAIARDGKASASWGMISNVDRMAPRDEEANLAAKDSLHEFGSLIQTDVRMKLGCSGGALVDLDGRLIGLTTTIKATGEADSDAGFAIAADAWFRRAVEQLQVGKLPEYGFLGVEPADVRAVDRQRGVSGALIKTVMPGLPGEKAGIRSEDVIFQIDGAPIHGRNDLSREISMLPPGREVSLALYRQRPGRRVPEVLNVSTTLSKKPVTDAKPAFASQAATPWRGMLVEYATAVPPEMMRGGILSARRGNATIAVLSVEPDTPAWRAGIRPGYGVLEVAGDSLASPSEFYDRVQGQASISLLVSLPDGGRRNLRVTAE